MGFTGPSLPRKTLVLPIRAGAAFLTPRQDAGPSWSTTLNDFRTGRYTPTSAYRNPIRQHYALVKLSVENTQGLAILRRRLKDSPELQAHFPLSKQQHRRACASKLQYGVPCNGFPNLQITNGLKNAMLWLVLRVRGRYYMAPEIT